MPAIGRYFIFPPFRRKVCLIRRLRRQLLLDVKPFCVALQRFFLEFVLISVLKNLDFVLISIDKNLDFGYNRIITV